MRESKLEDIRNGASTEELSISYYNITILLCINKIPISISIFKKTFQHFHTADTDFLAILIFPWHLIHASYFHHLQLPQHGFFTSGTQFLMIMSVL